VTVAVTELVAYAEEFGGVRDQWERAVADGLSPHVLVELASRLRLVEPPHKLERGYKVETEPRFKLRAKERRALAVRLIESGRVDDRWARRLGMSRTTWWRIRRELEGGRNGQPTPTPQPSVDAGLRVSNRAAPTAGFSWHFDASSGAEDDRPLRDLLGVA
jgi:hypothetical protein